MSEVDRSRYFLLALTTASYAVIFPIAWIAGIQIDYSSMIKLFCFALAFLLVFSTLCGWRGITTLRAAVECGSTGTLLTISCTLAAYLAMRVDMPLVDHSLAAVDRNLGIDWPAMIRFVDARPLLGHVLLQAYQSIAFQLLFLPIILALSGKISRSYRLVSTYGTIVLISSVISIGLPAFGTVATYQLDTSELQSLNPYFWSDFVEQLRDVRENPDFIFRLSDCRGVMTFPSVHAAVAVLCAWAAWDLKLIRYPMMALNLLMAISAFIIANHYVIDVVAGCAISALCISLVRRATRLPLAASPSLTEPAHLPIVR